jgi:hypothetical protein
MPSPPSALTIRMYNVGFGDCFLLSFEYPKTKKHVLVDFGSTAAPKRGPKGDFMGRIAEDIRKVSEGRLAGIVASHRHRDHISGFSSQARSGKIIASLKPEFVIQPWTEDPKAKPKALTASSVEYKNGKATAKGMTAHFLGSLDDMHAVAQGIERASKLVNLAGPHLRGQLGFLGEDNIKNVPAIRNLMAMGKAGRAFYVNAGMSLNILPGVKCTVLGPPTLKQSNAIRKQRARDPAEFWQFRSFWASQGLAVGGFSRPGAMGSARARKRAFPVEARWFVEQSRQIQANQMLGIVRDLDSVMNNTSVILLLQVGKKKILLPGDAQIENWAYALSKPSWRKSLSDVDLYKVGHHGSLNATPKSLWSLFKNKGKATKKNRLATLCSTKAGKHGTVAAGTEVPRRLLLDELMTDSNFTSTEDSKESFCHTIQVPL